MLDPDNNNSSLRRALAMLRLMAKADAQGMRVKDLAQAVGCSQPTAHRALQDLVAEGFAEQVSGGKRYGLAREAMSLAARLNPFDASLCYPSRGSSIFGSLKA